MLYNLQYSDNIKVVRGILILDEEGNAITKKYYTNDFQTAESQTAFEQKIFKKFKPVDNKDDSIDDNGNNNEQHQLVYQIVMQLSEELEEIAQSFSIVLNMRMK